MAVKIGDLSLQRIRLYQETQQQVKQRGVWFASALAATLASIYVAPWLGLVISILQAIWFLFGVKSNRQLLDWDYMIQAEQSRLLRIYRFINLFTDVPQITTKPNDANTSTGCWQRSNQPKARIFIFTCAEDS